MLSRSEAEQFDTKTFDHIDGLDKMDGYISDDDLHKFFGMPSLVESCLLSKPDQTIYSISNL